MRKTKKTKITFDAIDKLSPEEAAELLSANDPVIIDPTGRPIYGVAVHEVRGAPGSDLSGHYTSSGPGGVVIPTPTKPDLVVDGNVISDNIADIEERLRKVEEALAYRRGFWKKPRI